MTANAASKSGPGLIIANEGLFVEPPSQNGPIHKSETARNGINERHPSRTEEHQSNGNACHTTKLASDTRGNDLEPLLRKTPAYSTSGKLRVVTIGAGFSGLIFAHKLRYEFPEMESMVDHTIFEARADVGGTWLVNTYPGVRCDVPSHIYGFPFDPNPDWSDFYSSGADIEAYIRRTVKKWNLDRDVQLNTRVVAASWRTELGQWELEVDHDRTKRTEYAHVLISGQGVLDTWNWPDIPGLQDFKGHKVHSASWDWSYGFSHKRIAIIGNGSSAIQILPSLAKLPGTSIVSFQRTPTWIIPDINPGNVLRLGGPGDGPDYTEADKESFRRDPEELFQYRKSLHHFSHKSFKMFIKGSPENQKAEAIARELMAQRLNHHPELCKKLIPDWEVGCRRITPGVGYLESFLLPNVSLTQSAITRISNNAIITADGEEYEVDAIVCATGFDVSYRPRYPIVGLNGVSLAEKWKDEPESYLSLACPDFPNYFIFGGPNAVIGHGSLIEGLSWTGSYITRWLKKIATEDIKSVVPKQSTVDQFIRYSDEIQQTLVWTGACRSWYKNNRVDGRVTATFGGSAHLYQRMISEIRGEDFDIEYNSRNKFRFMGNGFTEFELDESSDLAFYLKRVEVQE